MPSQAIRPALPLRALFLLILGLLGAFLAPNSFFSTVFALEPSQTTLQPSVAVLSTNNGGPVQNYQGIPVGFTAEGQPYIGQPTAPLTLVEYSDLLCPFCARHFAQTYPTLLEKYIRPGRLKYVFRDFPIASLHPNAPQGAAAAQCVAEQGAALFWAMHDELMQTQQAWGGLADPTAYLAEVAKKIGADPTAYKTCMGAQRASKRVATSIQAAEKLGFNATPSFHFVGKGADKPYTLIGAQPAATFAMWIEALLAGKEPPQEPEAAKPELPFWAKPEGLQPDPKRPGYTVAGDQYKGDPAALITVVEFSDFQCPACAKHVLETQGALDEQFVETGQVRWVFKHLPLREHAHATIAAAAAECAANQGRFWEMHDQLFAKIERWAKEEPDAALLQLAEELQLDRPAFEKCLNSRQALEPVLRDLQEAQGIIQQTPTFVIVADGSGTLVRGVQEPEQFSTILRQFVERAQKGATNSP